MSAIAMGYPPEIDALREGLDGFLRQEVVSRHERHADLLDTERRLFTDEGRYHPDALALIREVRMAAAQAGYYTMCVPTSLGGAGLGHLAWFAGWERIFHRCSEHHWLGHYAISHWAFGPSAVLTQVSERARAEMLNLAVAAYFQAVGDRTTAKANWSSAGSDANRYTSMLKPYIAFPTDTLTAFMPSSDYRVVFDPTDPLVHKATLYGPIGDGLNGEITY